LTAFLGSSAYLATMMVGAVVGLFPVLLPTVGTAGRDITISLALAGSHTLHVGLVWWTLGILLAIMYFVIIHWLFRGKVPRHADGYGH
jgi:cytochrome d ubiquinol oxidase subunit II